MGLNQSSTKREIAENPLFLAFVGKTSCVNDEHSSFWDDFLDFDYAFPFYTDERKALWFELGDRCESFIHNNGKLHHFQCLIKKFKYTVDLVKTSDEDQKPYYIKIANNCVILLLLFTQYIVENVHSDDIYQFFSSKEDSVNFQAMDVHSYTCLHDLLCSIIDFLLSFDPSQGDYHAQLNLVQLFLTLMGRQLFPDKGNFIIVNIILALREDICRSFIKRLVVLSIDRRKKPDRSVSILAGVQAAWSYLFPSQAARRRPSSLGTALENNTTKKVPNSPSMSSLSNSQTLSRRGSIKSVSSSSTITALSISSTVSTTQVNSARKFPLSNSSLCLLLVLVLNENPEVVNSEDSDNNDNNNNTNLNINKNNSNNDKNNNNSNNSYSSSNINNDVAPATRSDDNNTTTLTTGNNDGDGDDNRTDIAVGNENKRLDDSENVNKEIPQSTLCTHYMKALASLTETDMDSKSFQDIYSYLCMTGKDDDDELRILLFYCLLHKNKGFASFMFSRTDSEQLILPVLKLLYESNEFNPRSVYMILCLLLFLSQDANFNSFVHEVTVPLVPWFKEKCLKDISLGSLIIVILVQTIQQNLSKLKDSYLQTSCLAAIANMSAAFYHLHPYAADRIIRLFDLLTKKFVRLDGVSIIQSIEDETALEDDTVYDVVIYCDSIQIVLDIINNSFTCGIQHNPHLIYTVMHKRELFAPIRSVQRFRDVIHNIDEVLDYFSGKVEFLDTEELSYDNVFGIIDQASKQFPSTLLTDLPVLTFDFEESGFFFLPYIWSLIHNKNEGPIYWNRVVTFQMSEYEFLDFESASSDALT